MAFLEDATDASAEGRPETELSSETLYLQIAALRALFHRLRKMKSFCR